MTWAPGPVVTRRRLGGELKRLRVASGLLLEDVAAKLECSPSKISRLENGKGIPKYRDVRDMLDAYGIGDGELREQLLEWSQTGQAPMWWRAYADVLSAGLDTYVELEWDAARIQAYESHVVHGLLQTRDYARAVLEEAWGGQYTPEQIARMVEVRSKRQDALSEEHGLSFCCVLDESALYRVVGSPQILRDQIEHLVELADDAHVDVRVLPFSAGLVLQSLSSFAKLDFSGGLEHGLIYVETPTVAFLSDRADVAEYGSRLQALVKVALTRSESIPLMQYAARRI